MTGLKINREINIWSLVTTAGAALVTLVMASTWVAEMRATAAEQAKAIVKLEAADVAMTLKIETARDLASARQEALTSRLTRMEAILERIERNGSSRP